MTRHGPAFRVKRGGPGHYGGEPGAISVEFTARGEVSIAIAECADAETSQNYNTQAEWLVLIHNFR